MDRVCDKRISWQNGRYYAVLSKGVDMKCNDFLDEIINARSLVHLTMVHFSESVANFEKQCTPDEFAKIYEVASQYGWC